MLFVHVIILMAICFGLNSLWLVIFRKRGNGPPKFFMVLTLCVAGFVGGGLGLGGDLTELELGFTILFCTAAFILPGFIEHWFFTNTDE